MGKYDDYRGGSGKQGFASMSKDQVRAIGIKGRAQRFGRTEEEESDYEEHNREDGSNYNNNRSSNSNRSNVKSERDDGRRSNGNNYKSSSKSNRRSQDGDDSGDERRLDGGVDRRHYGGFASNPDLGIAARAKRFGRSFEEESDVEEENRKRGETNHGYGPSKHSQSKSGGRSKNRRSSQQSDDDEEESSGDENERSYNRSNRSNRSDNRSSSYGKGKQGFASMPKEKVRAIASKGGRTAHAGEAPSGKKRYDNEDSDYNSQSRYSLRDQDDDEESSGDEDDGSYNRSNRSNRSNNSDYRSSSSGKGKQGFASMPKEKVRAIASKGGRTAHAGEAPSGKKRYRNESDDHDEDDDEDEEESSGDENQSYSRSSNNKSGNYSGRGSGKQGFASMPKEKVRAIASKGGRSSGGSNKRSRNY